MFIESTRRRYKPEDLALIGAHDLGYNSARLINVSLYEKWEGCQAGISVLGIRSDGGLIGCLAINDDRFVEGNVRTTPVKKLWRSRSAFPYTRDFRREAAGPECAACRHLDSCKGGCSEMSLMKTGRLHNDPYCYYAIERADGSGPSKMERLRDFFDQCSRPGSLRRLSRVFSGRRKRRET
jgi:radical SAM protein with 4Fe4S-binding SPASM domain